MSAANLGRAHPFNPPLNPPLGEVAYPTVTAEAASIVEQLVAMVIAHRRVRAACDALVVEIWPSCGRCEGAAWFPVVWIEAAGTRWLITPETARAAAEAACDCDVLDFMEPDLARLLNEAASDAEDLAAHPRETETP